jgi:hypothetical protein
VKRALVFALLAGCAPSPTEALLEISADDLIAGRDYDTIHIDVRTGGVASGAQLSSVDVKPCTQGEQGDGCKPVPFTVLFVPGEHPDVPGWVNVIAKSGGNDLIHDAFVLAFLPGRTLRYQLVLYRVCEATACGDEGRVCNASGACETLGGSEDLGQLVDGSSDVRVDAGVDASVDASVDAGVMPRRVFLAGPTTGAMNGLTGADGLCNTAAQSQAWSQGGHYLAVIATTTVEPLTRIILGGGARPIARADGQQVATDATFWEVHHSVPIDQFADGHTASGAEITVFTNFDTTGHRIDFPNPLNYCNDLTTASGASMKTGRADDAGPMTPSSWAYNGGGSCAMTASIYCMEQ